VSATLEPKSVPPQYEPASFRERLAELRALAEKAARTPAEAPRLLKELAAGLESLQSQAGGEGDETSALSAFLQTSAEREKASLARELHDELGGILTPAKMDLAWLQARLGSNPEYAERMRRLGLLIDQGIDLKRRVIERLRPSLLDHLGLAAAIQWYTEEVCRDSGLECDIRVAPTFERLPADLEIAFYRLVQDSLSNVVRHAQAKKVTVSLQRTQDALALEVSDDGIGIGDLAAARRLSYGMSSMRQRVRAMGGSFEVTSTPGQGTRVRALVPRAS
jgi:signal transduction histidine kinase